MKITKTKYKLVLSEPGKEEKIVWTGTEKECKKKKLELSFTYNSDLLSISEVCEEKEVNLTFRGLLGFMCLAGLAYISWVTHGKKIYLRCLGRVAR